MQAGSPFSSEVSSLSAGTNNSTDARFSHQRYVVSRKLLKLLGGTFFVRDLNENLLLYANLKAFKLKEDIRLFTDENKNEEVLTIKARSILDFGATYDVTDARTGQHVGALRRKGWKSLLQDEWIILTPQDQEMGSIKEDSTALALVRRFIEYATYFLPQKYTTQIGNRIVAYYKQTKNPFSSKLEVDFSPDSGQVFDRRLGIAAAILLCAIEGKQH